MPAAISADTPSGQSLLTRMPAGLIGGNALDVRAAESRFATRSLGRGVRPIQPPTAAATSHHARLKIRVVVSPFVPAAMTVTAPRAVASPAVSRTVALRKSVKRTSRG